MMENQQQDANNDPAVRVEQKSRLPTDIWVLCKSKTYPGLLYYFNKATGEAMWSMDFEKHKEKKTICDVFKRSIQFSHNYPEPQVPPSKSQYSLESPSSSHVYNKQIINNKFSRNPYPWSTFGNVTFPNYLAHPISNQFSYNFPEVHFNQNAWAIPANQPVFVGPAVSIPNEKHSFNLYHNDEIAVQKTSISLSDRFKNLGSGVDQVSRKIEIPRIDKSNPRFGKSFRHKPENSTRNINEEDASNKLHYNDLRLMLVAKRRKSVDVSEMKNENEESDVDTEYNNENDLEENQENITMKMTGLKVSNPITPEVSTSSLPFRKKVTFDSLDIKDTKSNTMEEEINSENMYEDDMDLHGTLPQIDVTPLKRLSKPNDRNDLWFIVVDTCVLLSNLFFVNMLVKSDSKCRMMIPYRVHDELESQCSDMFRNHTLRTVGMAQRARRYISKELNARTSVVAQTAVEAEDRNINCPKEDDDILNCCLQLASQSFHVILLTNDENLIIKSSICGIQSFTVKNMKKYLSGKEPERTFLPAPLKITIENNRKGDAVFKQSNFLINNTRLNTKSNIHQTDNSKNSTMWQNKFNLGKITSPQRRGLQRHVFSNKSKSEDNNINSSETFAFNNKQDVECQTSEEMERTTVKKSDLFINENDLCQGFVYNNDHKNCDQVVNHNSVCTRNRGPQYMNIKKTNNIENIVQNKTNMSLQQTKKGVCSDRFAHIQNTITNKINNNTDNCFAVNASDVQKNKKREIHLKRSNNNALNDATTICTKKRPFKWRRKNIVNKNVSNESSKNPTKPKITLAKLVANELSKNKYSSQDLHINKACEPNVRKHYKSSDDMTFQQSENTEEEESNDLEDTVTSVSTHMPQEVTNYVSEFTNARDMDEIVLHDSQSSNLTKSNDIGEKAINEKLRYNIDGENNEVTKERFLFNFTDKIIEEKFKMGCDEWLSRYVQIMEEVLTQILQQNSSANENKLLPPPWTLHEAAQCIKVKYKSNASIITSADQLSFLLLKISDKIGKISTSLNPEQFMKLFNYGFNLVDALSVIHTNCEDIAVAKASLYKLLNDIQEHNSHRFDTEVTMGLEDMLNMSNRSTARGINQTNQSFSSITSNNLSSTDEKLKSPMKVRNSDQEIWKTPNDVQTRSIKLINNKDTNDISDNCMLLPNVTTSIKSKDDIVKDQLKVTDLKRTRNVHDEDNAINSAPSEYVGPIEKTQVEASSVQPKIIRNFTGIPDFEKRLSEKRKSAFRLDNLGYSKLGDLCYESDEEGGYLDEEYESEFSDEFETNEHDSLYDISKDLNVHRDLHREVNEESIKQKNQAHQVDAPLFKKPMDVNKENEKVKEHKNIEIVIKTFLREIKETFLQVHTYCQEILKEIKQTSVLSLHRKQEIYKQTENTHNHLNNIKGYLKTILQRDSDDADKDVQSLIHKVILKNLSSEREQSLTYREIIAKCLDQASILSEALTDILSMSKQ